MGKAFKVACVQNRAGPELDENIEASERMVREACSAGAELVCLPEFFSCLDVKGKKLRVGAVVEERHPALRRFRDLAGDLGVWIQLGSLAIESSSESLRNRSYTLDHKGNVVARYDKLHMFDVDLPNGESYRESDTFACGDKAVLAPTPWGLLGMTVCYDLRFAYLYRTLAQAGAAFISVPAAFTKTTGEAHWHVLLRSRAIETGCYIFAACQNGRHGDAVTYGHSLIVDPWGSVIADGGEESGFIIADVDVEKVDEVRGMIPSLTHDRSYAQPMPLTAVGS